MLALIDAGIKVERYVAYEIDKYAIQTSSHNFPMIEHCGDVFEADFTEYCDFDFLIGGSPCTYWSIAQKNNRETEAGGMGWQLFSQFTRALNEAQPKFFIYENNQSMSKDIRQSISQTFGFEPICINSSLVSAQNRNRLYWVGKRRPDGTYRHVNVSQPSDLGILLRDIFDGATSQLANDLKCMPFGDFNGKSFALTATYWKGQPKNKILEKSQRTHVAEPVRIPEYIISDKSRCVAASYANKGSGEGSLITEAFPDNPKKQVRDYVAEPIPTYATACDWNEYGEPVRAVSSSDGKTYMVFKIENNHITIKGKKYFVNIEDGYYIIRKLTVSECKRLQTVPEWYEFPVSDTQAYKMLGNGWTVRVISHLILATQEVCN